MTTPTRDEIEHLIAELDAYGHPWQSTAIRSLLADRDRLERERDEAREALGALLGPDRELGGRDTPRIRAAIAVLSDKVKNAEHYADDRNRAWSRECERGNAALTRVAELEAETVYLRKQWENAEAAIAECKGQNEWLDRQLTHALTPKETP